MEARMEERSFIHDTELWEYDVGEIISHVPVGYFKNDKDAMEYRRKNINKPWWKKRIDYLTKNFESKKFKPIYYCKKCRRMEDGARRLHYAELNNFDFISVKIGDDCYKRYKKKEESSEMIKDRQTEKYWDIPSGKELLDIILSKMKEFPTSHRLDKKWLLANVNDKWKYIDQIDFEGKSYLDVGCHVGYSCFRAWQKGADHILGIDIRADVLRVAEEVGKELNAKQAIFINKDWSKYPETELAFDIVSMLGLIHYFPKKIYKKVLKSLCDICKETLILELRIIPNSKPFLIETQRQTLPSTKWLSNALKQYGFNKIKRYVRETRRELWIAER